MKVSFHTYPKGWPWPASWYRLIKKGHRHRAGLALRRAVAAAGHETGTGRHDEPDDADMFVMWSWKQPNLIRHHLETGKPLLVLERGYIQPRRQWVSLTWNGFNGRGAFPGAADGGERFRHHHAHLLKPWRRNAAGPVLLVGQVPDDAALGGADIRAWASATAARLVDGGFEVIYRPHPEAMTPAPPGCQLSRADLATDLERCGRVVTFNSTTAVEAVMAGVPTWVLGDGSVAAPVAARDLDEEFHFPDRTAWCHDLAWRQWRMAELADGSAWRHAISHLA